MNLPVTQLGVVCVLRGPSPDQTISRDMGRRAPRARWRASDACLPRDANSGCAGGDGKERVKQAAFAALRPAPLRASAPSHFSAIIVKGRASAKALS